MSPLLCSNLKKISKKRLSQLNLIFPFLKSSQICKISQEATSCFLCDSLSLLVKSMRTSISLKK